MSKWLKMLKEKQEMNTHVKGNAESGAPRATLKQAQRFELYELIKKHVVQDDDGFCHYINGKSDVILAQEFGCSPASVAGIRQDAFGKLAARTGGPISLKSVNDRLNEIEDYLTRQDPNWRKDDKLSSGGFF